MYIVDTGERPVSHAAPAPSRSIPQLQRPAGDDVNARLMRETPSLERGLHARRSRDEVKNFYDQDEIRWSTTPRWSG